jgi:hypothetical protein
MIKSREIPMPIRTLRLPWLGAVSLIARSMPAQDVTSVRSNVVPPGTIFLIRLSDQLDSRTVKAGDPFQSRLAEPLVAACGESIASGKQIKGHVSAVQPGLRTRMILSSYEIETARGWVPLMATVTGVRVDMV